MPEPDAVVTFLAIFPIHKFALSVILMVADGFIHNSLIALFIALAFEFLLSLFKTE